MTFSQSSNSIFFLVVTLYNTNITYEFLQYKQSCCHAIGTKSIIWDKINAYWNNYLTNKKNLSTIHNVQLSLIK